MGTVKLADIPHYSYADYCTWEGRWELIHGIPYALTPAPSIRHQQISNRIAWQLTEALKECPQCHPLLPVDWKIDDDTVVQPDNLVVCYEPSGQYLLKAPTLIFEVISASTRKKDTSTKFELFQKEGVKYYCQIDPDENIAKVFVLQKGKYIKLTDATQEIVHFDLGLCTMDFDFSNIWQG